MAGGRPTKYTPELIARILVHLRYGVTEGDAARAEGISAEVLSRWKAKYPDLVNEVERAKGHFIGETMRNLNVAATRGSVQAAIWLMEHRGGSDYQEPAKRVEVGGPDGGHIPVRFTINIDSARRDD